jgi:hypothetical protein
MNLRELVSLNYSSYINTHLVRTLNRDSTLPYQYLLDDNETIPQDFQNHGEKSAYVNALLRNGGYVPVALVLYKIGFDLIDLTKETQQYSKPLQTDFSGPNGSYTGLAAIFRQLTHCGVQYWYQIVLADNTLPTLSQLCKQWQIHVVLPHIIEPSWEKAVKQVTDTNHKLLPQLNYNTQPNTPVQTATGYTPNFMHPIKEIPSINSSKPILVFTDGSKMKHQNNQPAYSSVFFKKGNPYNTVFCTTGVQSVFNAESQAAEYALFCSPLQSVTVISDCKSLVDAMCKLKAIALSNTHALPVNLDWTQVSQFTDKVMYQYSKSHRYSSVLQSILLQTIIREMQGFEVQFLHVYSHLLDTDENGTFTMQEPLRSHRLKIMQETYKQSTRHFLEGNQQADQQLATPPQQNILFNINYKTTTLPRFVLRNTETGDIHSDALKLTVRQQLMYRVIADYRADHPELELTEFSPEINWRMSMWPLLDKTIHNSSLQNFQYKLKQHILLTPLDRFNRNLSTKNIPAPKAPLCPVCLHTTEEANIEHIFGHCTVAQEHNLNLWNDVSSLFPPLATTCWFFLEDNQIQDSTSTKWQTSHGNVRYIPSQVTNLLSKEREPTNS